MTDTLDGVDKVLDGLQLVLAKLKSRLLTHVLRESAMCSVRSVVQFWYQRWSRSAYASMHRKKCRRDARLSQLVEDNHGMGEEREELRDEIVALEAQVEELSQEAEELSQEVTELSQELEELGVQCDEERPLDAQRCRVEQPRQGVPAPLDAAHHSVIAAQHPTLRPAFLLILVSQPTLV